MGRLIALRDCPCARYGELTCGTSYLRRILLINVWAEALWQPLYRHLLEVLPLSCNFRSAEGLKPSALIRLSNCSEEIASGKQLC